MGLPVMVLHSALAKDLNFRAQDCLKSLLRPWIRVRGFYMGGCQNYGPFLGPYYNTAPII